MRIESSKNVKNSVENIYNYLSDFNNFSHLLPDKVENWKCTEQSCSFSVKGLFHLGIEIKEKIPFTSIVIGQESDASSPFPFIMVWEFEQESESETNVKLSLDAEINAMIAIVAKKPLQNLVNIFVEKLDHIPT